MNYKTDTNAHIDAYILISMNTYMYTLLLQASSGRLSKVEDLNPDKKIPPNKKNHLIHV